MKGALAAAGFSMALWAMPAQAGDGPSFDCSKAAAPDELAICADPALAALDQLVAVGYGALNEKLGRKTANKVHLPFLRARRACKDDTGCIGMVLRSEVPSFTALGFEAPEEQGPFTAPDYERLKKMLRVGECSIGTIVEKGARLCSDDGNGNCVPEPASGVSVLTSNGIFGVSYEDEPGLRRSEVGHPVLSCLDEVPKDCPPGDDRGYMWRSQDLSTGGKWLLPDSQHMCGGA